MNSQISLNSKTFYQNSGNRSILQFLGESDRLILDIGCGAGDTGKLIQETYPNTKVTGVTCSQIEYEEALTKLSSCVYLNLEDETLPDIPKQTFDVLCFCHVLEHLVDPVKVINKLLPYLKPNGKVIIALPNVANWRSRWKLAIGRFEYTDGGVFDRTHLHYYTFYTAPQYLINPIPALKIEAHTVNGSVPLSFLRHHFLSPSIKKNLDNIGCHLMPNLFGGEIFMVARHHIA